MQVRLPWILSRKRLITAALVDGVLFTALYYKLFEWRFDRLPGLSLRLSVLLLFWLLCSYVFGRFTSGDSKPSLGSGLSLIRQIASTALVLVVMLGITLLHLWLFNHQSVEATLRSFLIPFLGLLAILSSSFQFILNRVFSRQDSSGKQVWSFVGSVHVFNELQNSLRWSRLPVSLVHILPYELRQMAPEYIVVEEISMQDSEVLGDLLVLQQNGSFIINCFDWCEAILQRFPSNFLEDVDLLKGQFSMSSNMFEVRLKRIGDILVSSFLLLAASPFILIAGVLIKINDGGPIFYSQIRNGFAGEPYRIWKLRTMKVDAELKGAQWSSRADSRITWIGSILRRTRLDELPQLWCVLNGTMSLIGPRPERPEFDRKLEKLIPYYLMRYNIRPGLSGWAQVNYSYGASVEDAANKLSYDLFYLRNFSFWLDLLILLKTIRLVFNAEGSIPVQLSRS